MTVISRKVYEPGGFAYLFLEGKCRPLPPNVARLESAGRGAELVEVTWDQVMEERRKYQAERLARILCVNEEPEICPCYVWTFFNRQSIPYHGWYCYDNSRHFEIAVNFKGVKPELATSIMTAIPLGILPLIDNFGLWMREFAETYPRPKHPKDPRKSGSRIGWISNQQRFTIDRPS